MNEGIKTFKHLLLTDRDFQKKLDSAMDAYTGEQTQKAVFENILVPLASEYDISVSYDDFHNFADTDREMDDMELAMIAGGKSGGGDSQNCYSVGFRIDAGKAGSGESGFIVLPKAGRA